MLWDGFYFVFMALCCLHTASEPLRIPEDYRSNFIRRRRSDENDSLALSREIFKNITKQLRENIKREGVIERNDHMLQNKPEGTRTYITYQSFTDHHHEHHWGPYFEEEKYTKVTAHVGAEALLNCRVVMLKDKTVMWLRNTTESAQLLTVGMALYASDNRIAVKFQYPNNWRLSVSPVKFADAGHYMCQISTHPPRTIFTNLTVLPPVISINGDETHEVKDRFYKAGSAIKLSCIISEQYQSILSTKAPPLTSTSPTTSSTSTTTQLTTKMSPIFNRIDIMINKSWSVETTTLTSTISLTPTTKKTLNFKTTTELTSIKPTVPSIENNIYGIVWKKGGKEFLDNVSWRNTSSTISVASASQNDSGTYTCHLQNHSQVTINLHVLIGENQAAVQHNTGHKGTFFWTRYLPLISLVVFIRFYP